MKTSMTVGFHAPLPPQRTGVADYAASLLRKLGERGSVKVDATQADVHLYHLGNNQLHREIYERALLNPGVIVLHDALLQHFFLGAFTREHYLEEYVYNYGAWERTLAEELWRERAGSGMDARYFNRPMLKRVCEHARAVIVHNAAAAAAVLLHAPNANVVEIPHFFSEPARIDIEQVLQTRVRLGFRETDYVFGVFGYLRESKRLLPILQSFEEIHRAKPHTRLVLAGDFASADLERAVQPYLHHSGIRRVPHLADNQFWLTAASVDCCLNLRYPGAGETSGIGIRLMGLGKPVFFSAGREIEAVPLDACVRVSPGLEERAELQAFMAIAVDVPWFSREVGARAASYIRDHHSLDRVADQYWNTLCATRASLS